MFPLSEKRAYYKKKSLVSRDFNESAHARGFLNGSSDNFSKRHYEEEKRELSEAWKLLKQSKNESDREIYLESISYSRGCLRGYEAKNKK